MTEVLEKILEHYLYVPHLVELPSGLNFFKSKDENVASYFLVKSIDCREFEGDEVAMKKALDELESMYASSKNQEVISIKSNIQKSFKNNKEASQIDKNTSAIYLLLVNSLESLNLHKNAIFSVEESANYFKRYVLPYTKTQETLLMDNLSKYNDRAINEVLSDVVNNEDEYYKLLDGNNTGSEYEFVIRLFSKIPFLQYKFKPDPAPLSIEESVVKKLDEKLSRYHELMQEGAFRLDDIVNIETDLDDEVDLDSELENLLGGGA